MTLLILFLACNGGDTGNPPAKDSDPLESLPVAPVDEDLDGVSPGDGDCDDTNPDIHPGQLEICNGIDDNCNSQIDEGWPDVDGDDTPDCLDSEDCDGLDNDGDGTIDEGWPDADGDDTPDCRDSEECDGLDNNGDGVADEGFDGDGDGYLSCEDDCDDTSAAISPLGTEVSDEVDNDCDGAIDEIDWSAGELVITEVMANPKAVADPVGEWIEVYNAASRTLILNGLELRTRVESYQVRSDSLIQLAPGERYLFGGSADTGVNGGAPVSHAWSDLSLDNENDELNLYMGDLLIDTMEWDDGETMPDPDGASMVLDIWFLDATSNDDPTAWCAASSTWGTDTDFGSPGAENELCPTYDHDGDGFSEVNGDCDDDDPTTYTGATEVWYNGQDEDCDGWSDFDADKDGYDSDMFGGTDCDDADDGISPGLPEICDVADIDEDCNGLSDDDDPGTSDISSWYTDDDMDGYGTGSSFSLSCEPPPGLVSDNTDCDDADPDINPGAEEVVCDGIDQDCGGESDCDNDADGFDANTDDCDDGDATVHPYAWEDTSDSVDNDCDGYTDGADPDAVTLVPFSDDDSERVNLTNFTFPFCDTDYSTVYMISNGRVTMNSADTSYSESTINFASSPRSVAALWDDLYPEGYETTAWVEYADAVGFYWRDMSEISYANYNTFSIVLMSDGRILIEYENIDAVDGLAGFSCASSSEAEVDLSDEADNPVEGAWGIGTGTESMIHEVFAGSGTDINDTDNYLLRLCGTAGDDNDGDGWTDTCGDSDDTNADIHP